MHLGIYFFQEARWFVRVSEATNSHKKDNVQRNNDYRLSAQPHGVEYHGTTRFFTGKKFNVKIKRDSCCCAVVAVVENVGFLRAASGAISWDL